jgi:hypothetical protein
MVRRRLAALQQRFEGNCAGDHDRGVALKKIEEAIVFWHKRAKPIQHDSVGP